MLSKNIIRTDLNRLRKLCKSIRLIKASISEGGGTLGVTEGVGDSLSKELTQLIHKRDKILDKYRAALDTLSPVKSVIFTLYYLEGKTQKQVATKTNYCKSSITKHLSAIINKLK